MSFSLHFADRFPITFICLIWILSVSTSEWKSSLVENKLDICRGMSENSQKKIWQLISSLLNGRTINLKYNRQNFHSFFPNIFALCNKFFVYTDAQLQQQFCMHIESSFPIYDKLYLIMINVCTTPHHHN